MRSDSPVGLRARGPATLLPYTEPPLAFDALAFAELATWLLASADARLLCAAAETDGAAWTARILLSRGSDGWAPSAAAFAFPTIVVATQRAALSLVDALIVRWPSYARPTRLGLVSDGAGVGVSPDDPWPPAPGWLARQRLGTARLTQIIPFASWPPHT